MRMTYFDTLRQLIVKLSLIMGLFFGLIINVFGTEKCHATYSLDGSLHIPCVDVPGPFGTVQVYKADMKIVPLTNPFQFVVIAVAPVEDKPTNSKSCREIKENAPSSEDGIYKIDPDGEGGNEPFEVYCDMTTNGGGWTLFVNIIYGSYVYDQVISTQLGTNTINNNFIGSKPYNTVARMRVEGNGSSPFAFDVKQNAASGSYVPSTDGTYHSIVFDFFTAAIEQDNTDIKFNSNSLAFYTSRTGYHSGSFVYISGGFDSIIDGYTYNSGNNGVYWVNHQQVSGNQYYHCANTMDIGYHLGSNNVCSGKIATKIQLYYR